MYRDTGFLLKRGASVEIFRGGLFPRGSQPGWFDHQNVYDTVAEYPKHAGSGSRRAVGSIGSISPILGTCRSYTECFLGGIPGSGLFNQ